MNIALFGGSFDPPHNAHNAIINSAILSLDIDKLIVIPTYINPFKTSFCASPQTRFSWCEKLWQAIPKVHISKFEIEQKKAVPSIDSVLHFKKIYNPNIIYLIIGADQLINLETWYKFKELKKMVKFVVASRNDIKIAENLQKLNINVKISSTEIRESLDLSLIPKKILQEVQEFYKEKNAK